MMDDSAPIKSPVALGLELLRLQYTRRELADRLRLPVDELEQLCEQPDDAPSFTRILLALELRDLVEDEQPMYRNPVEGLAAAVQAEGLAMFKASLKLELDAAYAAGADVAETQRIQTEGLVRAMGPDALVRLENFP